jgi:FLVCR family MFS transporter 7
MTTTAEGSSSADKLSRRLEAAFDEVARYSELAEPVSVTVTPPPRARWRALATLSAASAVNQAAWIACAPVRAATAACFGVSVGAVDSLSLCFMVLYPPLALPAAALLADARGPRRAILLGAWLTAAGCAVRALALAADGASGSFALLLVGQVVAACAQPLLLAAPPVLAAAWFPLHERAIATTLATAAATVGAALGMVAPLAATSVGAVLRAEAALAVLVAGAVHALLPALPPHPPSAAARTPRLPLGAALAHAARARGGCALLCAFALPLGSFNALATLVDGLGAAYGFAPDAASVFGAVVVGCGLVGSALVAAAADARGWHVSLLRGCFALALPASCALPLALGSRDVRLATAALGALGFALMPVLPLSYELAAEVAWPAPEGVTALLLTSAGQLVGIGATVGGGALLREGRADAALLANAGCATLGLAAACAFRARLARRDADCADVDGAAR